MRYAYSQRPENLADNELIVANIAHGADFCSFSFLAVTEKLTGVVGYKNLWSISSRDFTNTLVCVAHGLCLGEDDLIFNDGGLLGHKDVLTRRELALHYPLLCL